MNVITELSSSFFYIMTNFIPIFPLGIVVFPGVDLNLHIFEPRNKQLIKECFEQKKTVGIPAVKGNKVQEYGTLVQITELSKLHDNGEMDIKTQGVQVFRILELIKEIPEKLYSGAIVNYPTTHEHGKPELMRKVMSGIRDLHVLLKVNKDFKKPDEKIRCYDIAHHVGLSLEQEYELLGLFDERQRQEYLKRHLAKVIPTVTVMEQLKEKIKLNGHFKDLPGFNV